MTFDAQAHWALTERIIACQGRSYFERVKKWGTETELPVFIIGMPRSGSTLVEQILASHPRVYGGGEIGDLRPFLAQVTTQPDREIYATPPVPNIRAARTWAADYLRRVTIHASAAGRVTIKTLENFMHLGVIATLFPRARVFHCRRDPVDVCLSCYFQNFHNVDFAWSLEDIGAYYQAYERLMAHWSRVLPLQIHEVRYEELIHEQEAVTRACLPIAAWTGMSAAWHFSTRAARCARRARSRCASRSPGKPSAAGSTIAPIWARCFGQLGRSANGAC